MARLEVEIDATRAVAGARQFVQATGAMQQSTVQAVDTMALLSNTAGRTLPIGLGQAAEGLSRTEREVLKLSRGISVLAGATGSRELFEVGNLLGLLTTTGGGLAATAVGIGAVTIAVKAFQTASAAANSEVGKLFATAKQLGELQGILGVEGGRFGAQALDQEAKAIDSLIVKLKQLESQSDAAGKVRLEGIFGIDILSDAELDRLSRIPNAIGVTETDRIKFLNLVEAVKGLNIQFDGVSASAERAKESIVDVQAALRAIGEDIDRGVISGSSDSPFNLPSTNNFPNSDSFIGALFPTDADVQAALSRIGSEIEQGLPFRQPDSEELLGPFLPEQADIRAALDNIASELDEGERRIFQERNDRVQDFELRHGLLAGNIQGGVSTLASALGSAAAGFQSLREAGVSALRSIEAQLVSTISQALIFRYLVNPFLSSFGVAFGATGALTTPGAAATSFGGASNIVVNVNAGGSGTRRTSRQAAEDFFRQGRVG